VTARAIAIISALVCALLCDSAGLAAESAVTEHVLAATVEQEVVASDLRIGGDDKQTRFVVDLNRKIDFAAFTLADPYRVVVDLPQVNFKLPAKAGTQSRGLIKAFRYGLIMQGGSRIVLDAKGPVRIEKAFVLDAAEGQPAHASCSTPRDLCASKKLSYWMLRKANQPGWCSTLRQSIAPLS